MMTSEQRKTFEALWREAFSKWLVRWMPGMRDSYGNIVLDAEGAIVWRYYSDKGRCVQEEFQERFARLHWDETRLPDPDDPATVGCLLAMAREVTGDDKLHVYWCAFALAWIAMWFPTAADCRTTSGTTEPEAIMRAILAAGGAR